MDMEKSVKNSADLEALIDSLKNIRYSNAYVYALYLNLGKSATKTASQLISETQKFNCKIASLTTIICRLNNNMQDFIRHIDKRWNLIVEFLNQEFKFPEIRVRDSPNVIVRLTKIVPPISPLKTRLDRKCDNCFKQKRSNIELLKCNKKIKLNCSIERKERLNISKFYQVRKIKRILNRKSSRISTYQMKLQDLQLKNISLDKCLKRSHLKCQYLNKKVIELEKKIDALQIKVAANKEETDIKNNLIQNNNLEIDNLQLLLQEQEKKIYTKENKKTFNTCTRLAVYRCLENNVPIDAMKNVINACLSMFDMDKDIELPTSSTVAQMTREMGIISELQVAETILESEAVTISFDATTVKGNHVNEIHFSTKEKSLTASIAILPGGKADDYVQHTVDIVDDLAVTHATYSKCDMLDIKKKISGKIMSTLTDRASVNHAAVVKLSHILERELLELNCHLHPIDGIANECRDILSKLNGEIPSTVFGSDCRAANLLYAISKLRYKAKGDPTGFKSFLKQNDLSCSVFPRYVGNRFHVLFCSAGIVYRYRQLLINYLDKYCNCAALRTAVLGDLKNDTIMTHLQALGLWGKILTGPWMALFYADENQRDHLELVEKVKCAIKYIQRILAEPGFTFMTEQDAFGRPLIKDDTLAALLIVDNIEKISSVLKLIAKTSLEVLLRQYFRYLEGDLSDPSDLTKEIAASAPVHNIWAERTLGLFDFIASRAPNAEITYLDGKTKAKVNKSIDWLCSKSSAERENIIKFCISRGVAARQLGRSRRLRANDIIKLRLIENGQRREMTQRNRLAKDIGQLLNSGQSIVNSLTFSSLTDAVRDKVSQLLNLSPTIEGMLIEHVWNVNGQDELFRGRFISAKFSAAKKKKMFRIAYWRVNEEEEEAEDSNIALENILTDVALGDLTFC